MDILTLLLAITNAVRLLYQREPLTWDPELATQAQSWAETLKNEDAGEMSHDFECQNLAVAIDAPHWKAEKAVCKWLENEGHRSTLLSREILAVGCGVAVGRHTVVICNYAPTPSIVEVDQKSICNRIIHINSS